jgi:phosphatidylglycerol:prolipoprotein diacylglycerol transferase
MLPVLQLGPLAVPVPALTLLLGVWVALDLAEREAGRLGLDADRVYRLSGVVLIAGLLGARLAYVVRHWPAYAADPLGIISPNTAALAPADGVLLGVLAALVYGSRRRLPLRSTLDAFAPGLAAMAVAVALAHAASGDAFGAAARLPWSIFLWEEYRHPSQFYELAAALAVLALAWRVRGRPWFSGANFLLVVALLAASRVFLEAFRGDSLVLAGGWRATQVWGLAALAVCLGTLRAWSRRPPADT